MSHISRRNAWRGAAHCLALAAAVLLSGCQAGSYMGNRMRDAADILSVSLGTGAGARARVGPAQLAVINNNDLVGLRAGQFFVDHDTMIGNQEVFAPLPDLYSPAWGDPVAGRVFATPTTTEGSRTKVSDYRDERTVPHSRLPVQSWDSTFGNEYFDPGPGSPASLRGKTVRAVSPFPLVCFSPSTSYYFAVELSGGLGLTFRLGFNAAELVDFIAGWTTVDILDDDLMEWELP